MTMSCEDVRDLVPGYVLGALELAEEQAVRDHLATCTKAHDEVDAFGGVVPYLDETVELVEPPALLKARVIAVAAAEPRRRAPGRRATDRAAASAPAGRRPPAAAPPPDSLGLFPAEAPPGSPLQPDIVLPFPVDAERDIRARRRRSPLAWVTGVAGVLAIVGLAAWNLLLQNQLAPLRDFDAAVAQVLDVGAQPGSQTAILRPASGGGPRGIASVAADGSVAIAVRGLAPTTGTEVYEAWAVAADRPTPLGSFTVAADGTGRLVTRTSPPTAGLILALTREPGPGATAPTLPLISSGTATAPPP